MQEYNEELEKLDSSRAKSRVRDSTNSILSKSAQKN